MSRHVVIYQNSCVRCKSINIMSYSIKVQTINPLKNIIINFVGGAGIYGSVINYYCSLEIWNILLVNDISLCQTPKTFLKNIDTWWAL